MTKKNTCLFVQMSCSIFGTVITPFPLHESFSLNEHRLIHREAGLQINIHFMRVRIGRKRRL